MRIKLLSIIIACLIVGSGFAQERDDEVIIESSEFPGYNANQPLHSYKKKVKFGKIRSHWAGISFGYNGLITDLGNFNKPQGAEFMKQDGNSLTFNLNLFDVEVVSTKPFSIISGIGMEFNTFRFSNNVSIARGDNGMIGPDMSYKNQGITLSKTKLSTNYFVIPLLAEFRFGHIKSPSRKFYVHGGVIGGWLYNGHTKVKYDIDNKTHKDKNKDIALNRFRYGYTIGMGWSSFGIFARYYPKSIFKSSYGPDVKQISIGIAFNVSHR